jgi:methylenetetrahydrofolate reductase (NADPH)
LKNHETTNDEAGVDVLMAAERPGMLLDSCSLEATARDLARLATAPGAIPAGTPVFIPFLPDESFAARIEAAATARRLGFVPTAHIAARRLTSAAELDGFVAALAGEAGVDRVLVIAGDLDQPAGPYDDALAVIRSGVLERHGIRTLAVSGYPEPHPRIAPNLLWQALEAKAAAARELGMALEIATQFTFDADPVVDWIGEVRARGIDAPIRIGIPGPASVKTLLRFAAVCGVAASSRVLAKYGLSLTRLLTTAGPDRLVDGLVAGLGPQHGVVHGHFYPFGGLARTAEWIGAYAARHAAPHR